MCRSQKKQSVCRIYFSNQSFNNFKQLSTLAIANFGFQISKFEILTPCSMPYAPCFIRNGLRSTNPPQAEQRACCLLKIGGCILHHQWL